jgi:hypothetical protein
VFNHSVCGEFFRNTGNNCRDVLRTNSEIFSESDLGTDKTARLGQGRAGGGFTGPRHQARPRAGVANGRIRARVNSRQGVENPPRVAFFQSALKWAVFRAFFV